MAARSVIAAMAAACLRGDPDDAALLVDGLGEDLDDDVLVDALELVAEQVELLAAEQGVELAVRAEGPWAAVLAYTSAVRQGDTEALAEVRELFAHMAADEVAIAAAVTVAGVLQVRGRDRAPELARQLCLREALLDA